MNEEIRLRSPSHRGRSPRGSMHGLSARVKRPSVGNILSQVPYLQRQHLSEANLVTVGESFNCYNYKFGKQICLKFFCRIINLEKKVLSIRMVQIKDK